MSILKGRQCSPLVHHLVRDFATQREIFSRITVASTALEDPYTAYLDANRTIYATSEKISIRRHYFENVPFRRHSFGSDAVSEKSV